MQGSEAGISGFRVLGRVITWFGAGMSFIFILIFLPARTVRFFNGWLFMGGMLIPMFFVLIYLLIKDPELLVKRTNMKERESDQKKYVRLSILLYLITYTIPGFDFRFHWSKVPDWLVIVSFCTMIGGYLMFVAVMLQNRYASRVIEIQEQQKLIDTGLYSVVRHPMYLAATILYLSSALVLGSWYALIPMSALPFLLAFRVKNEEKVLIEGLPGYSEYIKRVRFRILPGVW